jgi:HK97 family phage major capsid protein
MDADIRDLVTRQIRPEPAGTSFARFVQVLAKSGGSMLAAYDLAGEYRTTPQVARAFELRLKGAIAPGTSTDSVWAAPLVNAGVTADALSVLSTQSIVAQLAGRVRMVPFNVKVPADTTALLGDWIAELGSTPVGALALATVGPLEATKIGIIAVLTRELMTLGGALAEQTVRNGVLGALARTIDQKFLLPTLGPTVAGRPASITFGATAVTSTGATAAAIAADLGSMIAALTTTAGTPVWILRPTTAAKVAAALGTTSGLPATLYGIPAIVSPNSPAQITLIDPGMVLVADEGGFDVSISQEASVQMDSAPTDPAVAGTVFAPFFQQNLIGIRCTRWINWERAAAGAVVYMTVAY